MQRVLDVFEWIGSSRRLSWPMLFVCGVTAGMILGLATGLPSSGRVLAGTEPLTSILPEVDEALISRYDIVDRSAPRVSQRVLPASRAVLTSRVSAAPMPELPTSAVMAVPNSDPAPTPFEPSRRAMVAPEAGRPSVSMPAEEARPRIALVIDDLGLDRAAFNRLNAFPGPLTMAFLPYGKGAQGMIDSMDEEHEAILHLPMEPVRNLDAAGPGMLEAAGTADEIRFGVLQNLARLDGIVGVNNHTGSKFTSNRRAMETVLEVLHERDLFFLDSLTTKDHVAKKVSAGRYRVLERDVFLDSEWPDVTTESIKEQLRGLEKIAKQRGYAIAIAHPYDTTLETLGPWLVTIEARGFELVPLSELMPPSRRQTVLSRLR